MAIDKRTRLLNLKRGEKDPSYTLAGFFLHFPESFHTGPAAVDKHEEFFRFTEMDFVKVQFEVQFPTVTVFSPDDWSGVGNLSGATLEPQLEVVRGLVDRLGGEAVVVLTLYSAFMIAGGIGGHDMLMRHLEEAPEQASAAIGRVAETLCGFVQACTDAGLDGFYMSTQGGESGRFKSKETFERFIKPHDLAVMHECARLGRFNILHICDYHREAFGPYLDLTRFKDYPGDVVNVWDGHFSLEEVERTLRRPTMGGMDRHGPLSTGTPEEVRRAAREGLAKGPAILAADCTVPPHTPWENLREAVRVAHGEA